MISPTQRSLLALRKRGCLAAVVERYNAFVPRPDGGHGIRVDLWGFGDILAVEPGKTGALVVQACRTDDQSTRLAKIKSPKVWKKASAWLAAGNRLEVWGYAKRLHAEHRRKVWILTVTEVTE